MSFPTVALGTWLMGGAKDPDPSNDDDRDKAAIRAAIDSGVALIDTAQNYAGGKAESLVGEVLAESAYHNKDVRVLGKQNRFKLNSAEQIRADFDASLERLGVKHFEYYLLHAPNPDVPIDEFFAVANKLVKEGKIRNLGVSNFGIDMLVHAMAISEAPIVVNQLSFSPTDRHILESGLYQFCLKHGITVQAYRPLVESINLLADNKIAQSIAQDRNLSIAQVVVAWICSHEGVALTARASTAEHWHDILEGTKVLLTEDEILTLMVSVPQHPYENAIELEALKP